MTQQVRAEIRDGVASIVLSAPETGNRIDVGFVESLMEALDVVEAREDVRALWLRADGHDFSQGGNMRAFHERIDDLQGAIMDLFESFNPALERLWGLGLPSVAQVQGWCVGGALGMVSMADVVVAGNSARFRASFPGLGISNAGGSTVGFASRMGIAAARRFCMLNEPMSADEALTAGLADIVVPDQDVPGRAQELVTQLAAGPTVAYRGMRHNFGALGLSYAEALHRENENMRFCASSQDAAEAVAAFVEKRRPVMRGR